MAVSSRVLEQPSGEPITLDEAKLACRVDMDMEDDDDFIYGLIRRARTYVELTKGFAIVSRTVLAAWDKFPRYGYQYTSQYGASWQGYQLWDMRIPGADIEHRSIANRASMRFPEYPLQAVQGIDYTGLDDTISTVDPSVYRVDILSDPQRITPSYGSIWPIGLQQTQSVKIRAVVGSGPVTQTTAAITAGVCAVTPASMYGIYPTDVTDDPYYPGTVLAVDTGRNRELVTVSAATDTTFTATFAKSHPIGVVIMPGVAETVIAEMLMLISHWYTNRDAVLAGSYSNMPLASEAMHWLNWNGEYR